MTDEWTDKMDKEIPMYCHFFKRGHKIDLHVKYWPVSTECGYKLISGIPGYALYETVVFIQEAYLLVWRQIVSML